MRAALAALLLLGSASAAAAQPAEIRGADPDAYVLDLRYTDRGTGVLRGGERITFVNRGPAPLDRVWLRLWANGPERCRPRRISVRIEPPASAGAEGVECTAIAVRLATPVAPGAQGSVSLRFVVTGRRAPDRFGHIGGTSLLGNVIPVLAVEDDRGLHLEPYIADGESFYSVSARWRATLRLPARLRAATTGSVRSETVSGRARTLRVVSAQARDFGLAVGRLRKLTTRVAGVRVRAFAGRGVRTVRRSLAVARRTIRLLGRRLGRYESRELDVVLVRRDSPFGGMEYPELVFSVPVPAVVTHEVAHQWWYGMVGNDQYSEPWLDESFATYWHQRLHPRVNRCMPGDPYALVGESSRRIPLDASMEVFRGSPVAFAEVVYDAGSCALQTLERDIGATRMDAVLRLLQTRFRHGVMRKADVLAAIGDVAPEYALDRWLELAHLSP